MKDVDEKVTYFEDFRKCVERKSEADVGEAREDVIRTHLVLVPVVKDAERLEHDHDVKK